MPRLHFALVLHNHQPVGNYGFVMEQVFNEAYAPMLRALSEHPGVRVAIHNSGPLFDWIVENRPDYMRDLRALCDRGQVEMMTGGYYEPVLPMIPDDDKLGQIRKMTEFIGEKFGQEPHGLWLTERVWEPGLPAPLAVAGVRWTLVDDAHFRMVGLREDQLDGYYVTEDQGERVHLFAGSQRLRYVIPWSNVEDAIAELRKIAGEARRDDALIVLGDDGEKFGAWPTTYEHIWAKGWMDRFFSELERASDWLEMITPGEYARRFPARGLAYLPTASYAEMMEWAMPADASAGYERALRRAESSGHGDLVQYMRGGFWRYFLAKYPEANAMHKRGLRVGARLEEADSAEARDALWRGQCNCPYWHGVFGGLYLRHIRAANLANLVRAERTVDEARGAAGVRVEQGDFDFDGHDELLVQTPDVSLLLHPALGGMASEFDLRRRDRALLDVITRRREAYHEALIEGTAVDASTDVSNIHGAVRLKEYGLAEGLVFDAYRRGGLQEWIVDDAATPADLEAARATTSFEPEGAWSHEVERTDGCASVRMTREANGWRVAKRVEVPAAGESLRVRYECTNAGDGRRSGRFVSEWNFAAPQAVDGHDRIARLEAGGATYDLAATIGEAPAGDFVVRGSATYALRGVPRDASSLWFFPVNSVSSSEGGLERVAQGVSVSVTKELRLQPGETATFELRWDVVDVPPATYEPPDG
jgi:4-alpha-glucanotransferase